MLKEQFNMVFLNTPYGKVALSAGVNPLTGSWLWWYSNSYLMYAGNKKDIKELVKNIRKFAKNEVLSDTFTFVD